MFRTFLYRRLSSAPKLPEIDFQPSKYFGPSEETLTKNRKTVCNPAVGTYYSKPLIINQGYKQYIYDIHGKRYLDAFGGICTVSVGHCHPKITKAVTDQMQKLGHISHAYLFPILQDYALKLTEKLPGDLKVVYFLNSGSEANDLAVLLARAYTGASEIVSFKNSYHGMTYQLMGLTKNTYYKYPVAPNGGFHSVMNPDVFQGIWGGSKCCDTPVKGPRQCSCEEICEASQKYVKQMEDLFKYDIGKGNLAGFFAESIQGVGGTVQYPKGYIKEAYRITKEKGGLFISDEVQTGFGRTGEHFWGFQMHGIKPDIVTMAKGIGNGFPLAALVTTPEINKALNKAGYFNTYGGNPLACAAGIAVLDIIEEEELQKNSQSVGTYFLQELEKLKPKSKFVGDVRGKGLMIGVELVKGDGSTTPLDPQSCLKFFETCRDLGLIVGKGGVHGNVVRIKPPMCITQHDVDFAIAVINQALEVLRK